MAMPTSTRIVRGPALRLLLASGPRPCLARRPLHQHQGQPRLQLHLHLLCQNFRRLPHKPKSHAQLQPPQHRSLWALVPHHQCPGAWLLAHLPQVHRVAHLRFRSGFPRTFSPALQPKARAAEFPARGWLPSPEVAQLTRSPPYKRRRVLRAWIRMGKNSPYPTKSSCRFLAWTRQPSARNRSGRRTARRRHTVSSRHTGRKKPMVVHRETRSKTQISSVLRSGT
mmetsp:Transcript_16868/g.49088  ORF Transcript_16868/g.49088 Transcript_16868/m.49088 type:complete len:225 (-) Transcript_16868:320-994(-)